MTDTPDTLRPGYYVCRHQRESEGYTFYCPAIFLLSEVGTWMKPGNGFSTTEDPRTLGYTTHSLEGLLAAKRKRDEHMAILGMLLRDLSREDWDAAVNRIMDYMVNIEPTPQGEEKP